MDHKPVIKSNIPLQKSTQRYVIIAKDKLLNNTDSKDNISNDESIDDSS